MSEIKLARFELPNRLVRVEETATDTFAQFVAEPFERGYGHTIGNSLRRVLLSSLEGASITSVRISGVQHEFSSLPGVNPHFPALRSVPMALSWASRRKQIPSSSPWYRTRNPADRPDCGTSRRTLPKKSPHVK